MGTSGSSRRPICRECASYGFMVGNRHAENTICERSGGIVFGTDPACSYFKNSVSVEAQVQKTKPKGETKGTKEEPKKKTQKRYIVFDAPEDVDERVDYLITRTDTGETISRWSKKVPSKVAELPGDKIREHIKYWYVRKKDIEVIARRTNNLAIERWFCE